VASGPWIAITWSLSSTGGGRSGWLAVVHTTDPTRSWSVPIPAADGFEIGNPVIVNGQVLAVTSAVGQQSVLQRWPLSCPGGGCGPVAPLTLESHLGHLIGANADGTRLAVVGDELVEVVDLTANELAWTSVVPTGTAHFPSSRPTWTPASLVVATYGSGGNTRILRFDANGCGASTCTPSWTAELDGFSGGQIAAAGDILAVNTSGAPLVVLPENCADPCSPLYSLPGEGFWGAPLISDGRIFAAGRFDVLQTPHTSSWSVVAVRPPAG
jgi:hypothetical protein